ncbi:MAG: AEC family transporter [Lachnospiraceae bacterium]|nr:AEC family transporter [Lachnospiraceae bacterium]
MLLFQQMLALFIFLLIGYFMRKKQILDAKGSHAISWLIINIACPCMVIASALSGEDLSLQMFRDTFLLCLATYAALIAISLFLPALLGIPKENRNTYRLMTIFSNIGFMGYPLLSAMYGSGCLVYASISNVIYNILFYTFGIRTMQRDSNASEPLRLTNIVNPGTLACVVTLVMALARPPVPTFAEAVIKNLGALPASLAMIVIGSSLTEFRFSEIFSDWRDLAFSLAKLVIVPIVLITIAKRFVTDPVLLGILLVNCATPVGSLVVLAVQQYGTNERLAAKVVALTTVLSVVTIPIVAAVTGIR